jgi:CDP-glucose 4,6-dehydratase
MTREFWKNKRVLITGHTGFKGSWLSLWLQMLGAEVKGYALTPPTTPSMFNVADIGRNMQSEISDIRDFSTLQSSVSAFQPDVVFHLAAQSLVRTSYQLPLDTYAINVMGTANILEAIRACGSVAAAVIITSDKCYRNREVEEGYTEEAALGGYDPYSNSKACAELVTDSYRASFFNASNYADHGTAVATARAGNVIGGGDWAMDRLIPDSLKGFSNNQPVTIRNPDSVRPWQHVLDPLEGYLTLAEQLCLKGPAFAEAWNFGPDPAAHRPVRWIIERLIDFWGKGAGWQQDSAQRPHEATLLSLDCSKARSRLAWAPRCDLETALRSIVDWHRQWQAGADMHEVTRLTIEEFMGREINH